MGADFKHCGGHLTHHLSSQEQQRAQRKKIPAKQFEYVLGQAALRCLLAHALSVPAAEVRYSRGHKGKPALDPRHQRPDLHFNISHSAGLILVALSSGAEVGVDIEALNPHTSIDLVSRRAFSQRESRELQSLPEAPRRQRFFQLWTCKEAVVKCTGDGIHSGMNLFTVLLDASGQAWIGEASGVQSKTRGFTLTPLDLGDHHKGTLVCAGPATAIHRHYLPAGLITSGGCEG